MTGKDLAMALAVAAIVGGAAGAAASLMFAPKAETPVAAVPPEVLLRLKTAEDALAKATAALDESKKTVNDLSERVAAAEIKSAKQAGAGGTPSVGPGQHVRSGRRRALTAEDMTEAPAPEEIDLDELSADIGVDLAKALEGPVDGLIDVEGHMEAFRAGLEMRRLPEAERWQKAKDDLGLTWNQVEDLKKAVSDRDAAMKAAMTTEKRASGSGGAVTIQRPDAGKAAHAEADYHDRVNGALNEDQRKNWSAKGYDRAFGASPFGGSSATMVMSIDVSGEKKDAAKDGAK